MPSTIWTQKLPDWVFSAIIFSILGFNPPWSPYRLCTFSFQFCSQIWIISLPFCGLCRSSRLMVGCMGKFWESLSEIWLKFLFEHWSNDFSKFQSSGWKRESSRWTWSQLLLTNTTIFLYHYCPLLPFSFTTIARHHYFPLPPFSIATKAIYHYHHHCILGIICWFPPCHNFDKHCKKIIITAII